MLASVHYERMITRNVGLSTGIGYVFSDSDDGFSVPILLKYLKGEGSGKMELGVGATYVRLGDDADDDIFDVYESQWMGSLYIGYRYEADNGFLYRAGFSPFFNEEGFHPYTGFSVGCSF